MKLYLVKDGIKGVGCVVGENDIQIFNTNFHLLTYDFVTNEGYVDKKDVNYWRLYTQIGQKLGQSRYHKLVDFHQCIKKLQELKGDSDIAICESHEIKNFES